MSQQPAPHYQGPQYSGPQYSGTQYPGPQYHAWSPEQQAAHQWRQDEEYLKIFSILYYVYAGLAAFGGCFPLLYVLVGVALMGGAAASGEEDAVALAGVGGLVAVFFGLISLLIWGFAFCLFKTGRNLAQAKGYSFCFVIACLICMNMPFGTILGVFTIVTLSRDSMKARFERNRFSGDQPTGHSQQNTWQPPAEKVPPPFKQYS